MVNMDLVHYQASYNFVVLEPTEEHLRQLELRVQRLKDEIPILPVFLNIYAKSVLDLNRLSKKQPEPEEPKWDKRLLKALCAVRSLAGALSVLITIAESGKEEDEIDVLKSDSNV
jgi:hypothetical protein